MSDDATNQFMAATSGRATSADASEMEAWLQSYQQNGARVAAPASPEHPYPAREHELPAPPPQRRAAVGPMGTPAPQGESFLGQATRNVAEIPTQIWGGIHDAVAGATQVFNPLTDWLNENVADLRYDPESVAPEAKTTTGGITRGISQFLTGFIPALKGMRAAGVGGNIAAPLAAGAISDFVVREGHEGRLSDLWNQAGLPANTLTDYLKSDPKDSEVEGRFKNALEGAGLGVATEGIFLGARALRAARQVKPAMKQEEEFLKGKYGELSDEQFNKVIGDPTKPMIETKVRYPSKVGEKVMGGLETTIAPRDLLAGGKPKSASPEWSVKDALADVIGPRAIKIADESGYVAGWKPGDLVASVTKSLNAEGRVNVRYVAGEKGGGSLRLASLDSKSPEAVIEAVHEARHAQLHLDKGLPESAHLENKVNDFAERWARKNLSGENLNRALKHLDESDASHTKIDPIKYPPRPKRAQPGVKPEDFETYINFSRFDSPDSVKFTIGKMAEGFKGQIDEARRGTITHEETAKMAEDLGMSVTDLLNRRKGQPLNAEEALAARQLWAASGEKLLEAAKRAADPNAGPLDQFTFRKMMAVHQAIQAEVIGARTETARALSSWQIPAGGGVEKARAIDQIMGAMGGPEASREMAKRLAILAESGASPAAIAKFATRGHAAMTVDAIKEVWINGLLSSPKTHVVNTVSNTLVAFQQVYERKAAEVLSSVSGAEGVAAGESAAMMFGMVESIKDAFRMSAKALKTGETGFAFNKVDTARPRTISAEGLRISKDTAMGRFADYLGNVANIPGRLLGAEDEFFKTIGYRMELRAQSLRQAHQEGFRGAELAKRTQELIDDAPEHIRINAADAALYNTFTSEVGAFGRAVMNARNIDSPWNPLPFVIPFVRTPVNVARYAFERTPLAPLVSQWRADISAGGARADLALARMSTGTAIMLMAMDMADSGQISGPGPADKDKDVKEALARQGWQPYSMKIGDRWVSYNRLDPVGMTVGFAASITEAIKKGELDQDDVDEWQEVTAMAIAAVSQVAISKTYMEGISKLVEVMSDPKRYSEQYVDGLFASFLPATALSASVKNIVDPVQREAGTPAEAVMSRIAGLSSKLPPRRNLWGEQMTSESGLGRVYDSMTPAVSKPIVESPVDKEMVRLGDAPLRIGKKTPFDGVQVNLKFWPHIYDEYTRLAGNELKHPMWGVGAKDYLNMVVSGKHPVSSAYSIMSDDIRRDFIKSTIQDYRKLAQYQIMNDPANRDFAAEVRKIKSMHQNAKMPVLGG